MQIIYTVALISVAGTIGEEGPSPASLKKPAE